MRLRRFAAKGLSARIGITMQYNIEAYLPRSIKRARRLAKQGLPAVRELTLAEKLENLERFSYKAGGGGLRKRLDRAKRRAIDDRLFE